MSSLLLDLWESTWDSAVRTVSATGKALIGSHALLDVWEPNHEIQSCWKPGIISSAVHRAARLKKSSMGTALNGVALLCRAKIYSTCRNKRGNKVLFEHVNVKSKEKRMWKSWDRHTQAITSDKHFIIFCFFLSSLLITETQPVLNCLSLLIKKKVIRGLPHLLHYRCLGWKLLIDSLNFL